MSSPVALYAEESRAHRYLGVETDIEFQALSSGTLTKTSPDFAKCRRSRAAGQHGISYLFTPTSIRALFYSISTTFVAIKALPLAAAMSIALRQQQPLSWFQVATMSALQQSAVAPKTRVSLHYNLQAGGALSHPGGGFQVGVPVQYMLRARPRRLALGVCSW